ncbi:MAG: hypothetical protein ACKOAU_09965 [Pirellula sp.]
MPSHDLSSLDGTLSVEQQAPPDWQDLPAWNLPDAQQAQSQPSHLQTPVSQQQLPSEQHPFCKQHEGHPQSVVEATGPVLVPANTKAKPPTSIKPAIPK